jgi:hypothetical protein
MPSLTLQDRLSLLAFARATRESDPLARVHALFEAIEFYTSGITVPKLFSKSERKALVSSLPASFSAEQQDRVEHLVSNLNKPPLRIQLMQALDDEAVPMTSGEVDLLWRLRELRNDVAHGRKSELPAAEDVEHATSIVARMLLYRAATRGGLSGGLRLWET